MEKCYNIKCEFYNENYTDSHCREYTSKEIRKCAYVKHNKLQRKPKKRIIKSRAVRGW